MVVPPLFQTAATPPAYRNFNAADVPALTQAPAGAPPPRSPQFNAAAVPAPAPTQAPAAGPPPRSPRGVPLQEVLDALNLIHARIESIEQRLDALEQPWQLVNSDTQRDGGDPGTDATQDGGSHYGGSHYGGSSSSGYANGRWNQGRLQ